MTEVEIAKGLSEAQRRAIMCAVHGVIPLYYPTAIRISSPTFRRLTKLGLTEAWPPRLTPLGLRVRTILQENSNGPA